MRCCLCTMLLLVILAQVQAQATAPALDANPCRPGTLAVKVRGQTSPSLPVCSKVLRVLCGENSLNDHQWPSTSAPSLQDKGFPIGLAYWPGGTVEDWGNATAGLQPCAAAAGGAVRCRTKKVHKKPHSIGVLVVTCCHVSEPIQNVSS